MAETVRDLRPRVETFQGAGWRLRVVDAPDIAATAADRPVDLLHGARFPTPVHRVRLWIGPDHGSDRDHGTDPAGDTDRDHGTDPADDTDRDHGTDPAGGTGPAPEPGRNHSDDPDGGSGRPGAGPPAYLLQAQVHSGGRSPDRSAILGSDPLGVLLSRRIEAGDPRAARLGAGLETAVAGVFRRLGMPSPGTAPPSWHAGAPLHSRVDVDEATGLRSTVVYHAAPAGAGRAEGRAVTLRATVPAGELDAVRLAAFFGAVMRVVGALSGRAVASRDDPAGARAYVLGRHPEAAARRTGAERVDLDQVGGLDGVVAQFREIAVSFRHPGAMARWGARRPQGVLLYGPPGTGKTMLARALATEIGGGLREIRTPEILDKWLGASERNIKRIFREARRFREPTVLLFDEFDSIIGYAGAGEDSGSHAVNAVAGIFKQEMNNLIEENPRVIVVATTNFPDMIDDSLIRSGRFDLHLEIPLPDAAGRAQIISRMIRGLIGAHEISGFRMFADDVDITALAARTDGMSGADLREVFRRAQMAKAMQEARTGAPATPIGQRDLLASIRQLP